MCFKYTLWNSKCTKSMNLIRKPKSTTPTKQDISVTLPFLRSDIKVCSWKGSYLNAFDLGQH